MIQHYIKVSKLLEWIEEQRITPDDEDLEVNEKWDRGYDACLDSMTNLLEDFPLEDDKNDEVQKDGE